MVSDGQVMLTKDGIYKNKLISSARRLIVTDGSQGDKNYNTLVDVCIAEVWPQRPLAVNTTDQLPYLEPLVLSSALGGLFHELLFTSLVSILR